MFINYILRLDNLPFIRRGYLLLLTGILIGFLACATVFYFYSRFPSQNIVGEMPTEIDFDFIYTSEKQGWIEEVTPRFQEWFRQRFGITVHIRHVVTGTHDTVNRILDGSAKPAVWSPASSIWIPYINTKWRSLTGNDFDVAVDWTPLVLSPVVLVGWGSFM